MTASGTNTAQLYRAQLNMMRFPAGTGEQLIYCPATRVALMVPLLKAQILRCCGGFATLDQHAARVCNAMGYDHWQLSATRKIIGELADAGLLVSHQAFSQRLVGRPVVEEPVPPISSVGMPTCNRPQQFERGLRSYAECSREYGRQINFLVADQSTDADTRKSNEQAIAVLQKQLGIDVLYAGPEEKRGFVERLAAHSGIAPAIVNFALLNDENCPNAIGANRNAMLLGSLGELTMQVDDDTICRVSRGPESGNGLALITRFRATEFWFPCEEESRSLGNDYKVENIFALHEQLLGRSPADCISELASGELDLGDTSDFFFRKLERPGGRVLMTCLGSAGDSGIGTTYHYLTLLGNERSRLVRTESDYRFSMLRDTLINSPLRPTISDFAFCPGLNIGLDNRQLLPPFMPVQRGEDCIFSILLHSCSVAGYTGFLPWLVLHKHQCESAFTREQLREQVSRLRSSDMIRLLLKRFLPQPGFDDARKNMIVLGKSLIEWGSAPLADFEEMLRVEVLNEICGQIVTLEDHLQRFNEQPLYWADDVNFCLSAFREALTDEHLLLAHDLQVAFGAEPARLLLQRLTRRFGELLQNWPDLWQAAGELRVRGVQLGRKVK